MASVSSFQGIIVSMSSRNCSLRVFLRNFSKPSVRDCCFILGEPNCGQCDALLSLRSRINQRCPMLDSLKSVKSLVVRCPNWVGDIVMATPLFECLRSHFPEAVITACVRPYARGILEDAPWFDHIVPCQDKTLKGLQQLRRDLQAIGPDAGILLTNTTHSWLSFKFAGVPDIYGYRRNLRKHFLTDGPEPLREGGKYKPVPMQTYYLELCRYLGLATPDNPHCRLHIGDEVGQRGRDNLERWGISAQDT